MSAVEPDPDTDHGIMHIQEITVAEVLPQKQQDTSAEPSFSDVIKSTTKKWLLLTYEVFLSILHVTITMALASLGIVLVIVCIQWLIGNPAHQPQVIQRFLDGLKILSIFGVASTYTIYLIYSLLEGIKQLRNMTQPDNQEK